MGIGEIIILAIVVFVLGMLLGMITSCACVISFRGDNAYMYMNTKNVQQTEEDEDQEV